MTLRRALEQSRNIPAVKAMAELGPTEVVAYAKRFGLKGNYQPYLSLALGAAEATLVEMTSAYSAFPNQGVRHDAVRRHDDRRSRGQRPRARTGPSRTKRCAPTPRSS